MLQAKDYIKKLNELKTDRASSANPFHIMEVCGTHTMAIAECGLRQLLPDWVKLISGPGCPVCVTPSGAIDEVLRIASLDNVIICCYGDLMKIPGSVRGSSLKAIKAKGGDIRVVYSAMDAVDIAEKEKDKEVVFLGVGFETTAPGTAVSIIDAKERGIRNYSVLSMLKFTLPAINKLIADKRCKLDGLICPGHVATIIGSDAFAYLPNENGLPAVVAGFETDEVVKAAYDLCEMLAKGEPKMINDYQSCVASEGNAGAKTMMNMVFEPYDDVWRGLGIIENSGMKIKEEYCDFDASKKFAYRPEDKEGIEGCCCGAVLMGLMQPRQCPKYGVDCNPSDPLGPCMVSGEGACSAAFKYGE